MSTEERVNAPSVDEIERRFRGPVVSLARPIVHGGVRVLATVRRFGWTAHGLDNLQACEQPMLLAANHCSHVDTAAILGTLPPQVGRRTCVAAALDVFGPLRKNKVGFDLRVYRRELLQVIVAAGFHAFAFDRYGPPIRSLRTAADLSKRGWTLLLYPEGTRSRTGQMAPFKPGVAILAKVTGRPVVPIHVAGGRDILPVGKTVPGRGHAVVRYGEPIHLMKGENASDFIARVEQHVRALAPTTESVTEPPARLAAYAGADASKRSA